jgi:hypothetical protein
MHVPYSLLTLAAAAACWIVSGVAYEVPRSAMGNVEPHNPLAIYRSAYGSLVARLMKDSLHSYWHAGCTDPSHDHAPAPGGTIAPRPATPPQADRAPSPAGRFASRQAANRQDHPAHVPAGPHVCDQDCAHDVVSAAPSSWVDRLGKSVSGMEHLRTVRNSPFAVAPAHRRFLSASADWRVHVAWLLDPGDAALYEIDHFVSVSGAPDPATAKRKALALAQRTIEHALSPQAGPMEALTGAGAAINLLNDGLRPNRPDPPKTAELLQNWRLLNLCLDRHRELREQAMQEDWWHGIPDVRRGEIETYATMLQRLSGLIHQQLASNGAVTP